MKSPLRALFVMLAALLVPLCANAQTINGDQSAAVLKLMHNIVEKTNIERINRGLAPLKIHEVLTKAAVNHARDMSKYGYFAHSTPNAPDGVEDYEEYTRALKYEGRAGQNLYHGEPKAAEIIKCWMKSPEHRSNILEPEYNEIGIGIARGRDYFDSYCVQFFGIHKETYPVIINNEAYSTDKPMVHLYIYGQDEMKQMRFSTNGVNFSAWEPFRSDRDWTFEAGAGTRTIFVELSNGEKTFKSSDSIELIP